MSSRKVELHLPSSPIQQLDELAVLCPHAHRFLAAIQQRGPAVLDAVRAQLDDTLTVIDPDGPEDQSLAFLLGRPLALVRTRLDLQLCGPVRQDVTWQHVIDPPQPQMPGYRWTVRLGEALQSDDGLIGYVLDDDYDHFETVIEPRGDHGGYLRAIGRGERLKLAFDGDTSAVLTLLLDPRTAVHATTDILPVGSVFVPQQFTAAALAALAVNFRTGPLLIATTPDGDATLPQPATATGTWSWTEATGTGWTTRSITVPDPASLPIGSEPEIRSGFLVAGRRGRRPRMPGAVRRSPGPGGTPRERRGAARRVTAPPRSSVSGATAVNQPIDRASRGSCRVFRGSSVRSGGGAASSRSPSATQQLDHASSGDSELTRPRGRGGPGE